MFKCIMNAVSEERTHSSIYLGARRNNEDEPSIYTDLFPGS